MMSRYQLVILHKKMQDYCANESEGFSTKHMKSRLQGYFGDSIVITNINGKADVVTFRTTAAAAAILQAFCDAPKLTDPKAEEMRVVKAAADLIKNDIKCMTSSRETYPIPEDTSSIEKNTEFVPQSLRLLLQTIFSEKEAELKIASIGQSIVQAARPRVLIAPLQIGLAIQMHHHFGSKFLIDSLHSSGFSSSYSEVKRFEMRAACSQSTEIPGITPGHFTQYVADNADHNVRTLDGLGTFHGMGIIAALTPGMKHEKPVPRIPVSAKDLTAVGKIDIHYYSKPLHGMVSMTYLDLPTIWYSDTTWKLDLLWKVAWPLRTPRPGWSGMMQAVSQGSHPGKSSVTLKFVCSLANRHQITPVLTFDQPLWWKAQQINANEQPDSDLCAIVLRLGGFHTEMSFLGSIGHIMAGIGSTRST